MYGTRQNPLIFQCQLGHHSPTAEIIVIFTNASEERFPFIRVKRKVIIKWRAESRTHRTYVITLIIPLVGHEIRKICLCLDARVHLFTRSAFHARTDRDSSDAAGGDLLFSRGSNGASEKSSRKLVRIRARVSTSASKHVAYKSDSRISPRSFSVAPPDPPSLPVLSPTFPLFLRRATGRK